MKFSLKTKLSLSIALVVLLIVALISFLANIFIGHQFKDYIAVQQDKTTQKLITSISQQYDKTTGKWDSDFVHKIGMDALYDGYIISVYDLENNIIWDAETCDMELCTEVMDDISHRMMSEYPTINGTFTSKEYPVKNNNKIVGTIKVSNFGPYFLSEDDFQFLDSLNKLLIGISIFSLALSVVAGFFLAKLITRPIFKTVNVTKKISKGEYGARITENTNTKEVDELILSINHMAETLETQENLRKQLTADVAHELRTPLTTVQTHIEALVEGIWEPTTERLQSCYDEVSRICKLVNDLERLAKMDGDNLKLVKTPISLLELTNKVIGNFETELKTKNLNVTVHGDCDEVLADKDRISQVLTNLLSNAVKYTTENGEINFIISETENTVELSISDTGIGMKENELPFIFERFYRADKSRNRMTGGSGIGLAIVKSIVLAHNGSIDVKSQLEKGSCFTITLPK